MKKGSLLSFILALVLVVGLSVPAAAGSMGRVGTGVTVSTGGYHTAVLQEDGSLWIWGDNGDGQIGNGRTGNDALEGFPNHPLQTGPVKVMEDVASVSCGLSYTAALKTDGTLWTWGSNRDGQLGNGTFSDGDKPIQVLDGVVAMDCGARHMAAIKTDGSLWMWGDNRFGELGPEWTSAETCQAEPVKVMEDVAAVSCGNSFTAVIKEDGTLWTWGRNDRGQLGNGSGEGTSLLDDWNTWTFQTTPEQVMDNVVAVSCGELCCAAIRSDGTLWTWGDNGWGQLGIGKGANPDSFSARPVQAMEDVAMVRCSDTVAAVKTDGSLWMWGADSAHIFANAEIPWEMFGRDRIPCQISPIKVMDGVAAVDVNESAAAIRTDGTLWTWGANSYGQLGVGTKSSWEAEPTQVLSGAALTAPAVAEPTVAGFGDVHESDYYAQAVAWAREREITTGVGDGLFLPERTLTRAEAVTFLWRAAGQPKPALEASPFTDVNDPEAYYYDAVLWAAGQGIVGGVGNGRFHLNGILTYEQMLAMLCRAAGGRADGENWSALALAWAGDTGLTDGLSFTAADPCPRADVVYCMWKQMN